IWEIEEPKGSLTADGEWKGLLNMLPVPALMIAKDLSVEAANKSFETLLGGPAAGTEAWTLFLTRRGKPFTRQWLRDVIAKAEGPVAVQIACAGRISCPVLLHCAMNKAGRCLCVAMPADAAANLDGLFEALLARAPSPMALLSPKGVIEATNESFRELFFGDGKDLSSSAGLLGKSLALLVADASAQNVQDQIASLSAGTLPHRGPIDMQAVLKGPDGRRARLVIFPAANSSNLIVQSVETGTPALTGEAAAQSQKLQAVGEL